MTLNNPFVSVIITTYNREKLVGRAVSSVLTQTYEHFECIVVVDRSTDGTLSMLTELALQDRRMKVVSHLENRHLSAARNTGIYASKGDFIAFLDDDDAWLPQKLEKQVNSLAQASSRVGFVYCWFDVYREGQIVETRRPNLKGYIFDKLLVSQPLGNGSTLLVRREVTDRIGGFDETLKRGIDGDFIRRVGQHYEIEVVPEVLVHYFIDHDGHKRITGLDKTSILNGIRGHELKLKKFENEFRARPKIHAQLLATIAIEYAYIGDTSSSLAYFLRSIYRQPLPIVILSNMLRIIINIIRHNIS